MTRFAADRYKKMPYRRCGNSGLMLPAISLGLWQSLGQAGNDEEARRCVFYAFDNGVTHFDLANNYGPPPGNSEIVFGRILKEMPRDELVISTKAGWGMWDGPYGDWGSKKYLVASLDQSLKRMGLEYVDIFYHHRPDPDTPLEETLGALDLIVRQGKALYAGVSSYGGQLFRKAVDVMHRHDWAPITIHQPYYNMLDRAVETDLLPHTGEAGTGVIAFCPLAQGLLSDKYLSGLPADSRFGRSRDQKWYDEHKQKGTWVKLAALNEVAKSRGQTLAQMSLTYLLGDKRVTSALIGASRLSQVKENLAAANASALNAEEIKRINAILA